jgi:GDPmannose 4,6-dehydratase
MIESSRRTYLITGVTGQDGFYAARRFLRRGDRVVGLSRQELGAARPHVRLLAKKLDFRFVSLPEYSRGTIRELIQEIHPDRIVHAAGFRDLPANEDEARQCYFTNCELVDILLNAAADIAPRARFLFISSAEIFGKTQGKVLDEATPASPQNPYAVSKVQGMQAVAHFRRVRNLHAVSAICFNHESFLSPRNHLVRLVAGKLLALKSGRVETAKFFNTTMRRDWSHAKDFVAAFDLMLEQSTPADFIVASGKATTLREYVELACCLTGISSTDRLSFEERPDEDTYDRIACSDRIKKQLGWKPEISLRRLCREMIHCERQ